MIDYTQELAKIEKDLIRINFEIKNCWHPDVLHLSWEPMKKKREDRRAEINFIMEHEILFI